MESSSVKVVRETRLNQMKIRTEKKAKDRSLWHTTFKSGEVRETTVN